MDMKALREQSAKDEEGVTVTIFQPNGDPYLAADGESESTMTLLGPESKKVKDAKRQVTRRALNRRRVRLEPEEVERNRIMQAAAAVTAWHGWEADGEALPCTPDNVRMVLAIDHILDQVEAGILGHADFFTSTS